MTAELAKVINDGLYFYEQELQDQGSKVEYYAVSKRENKKLSSPQRSAHLTWLYYMVQMAFQYETV